MAYVLSKECFLKKLPQTLKKSFDFVKKMDDAFFASSSTISKSKIYDIKTSQGNIDILKKNISSVVTKAANNDFEMGGYKFRFILSGKKATRKGDAKTTQYQELCSCKVCENVFNNKETTLQELVKIYPDLAEDISWQDSFKAQEVVFKEIKAKYKQFNGALIFNREGGFMDWITKKVKEFGISQKDSWNPADMWIHTKDVHKELQDVSSVYELNNKMLELFKEGKLLGISLKKTGKKAKYEETNFAKLSMKNNGFIKGKLLLDLKKSHPHEFTNDEFSYDLNHPEGTINVQVRMFPKKAKSNVQVSYKLKGGKAEMGKVPSVFRNIIWKDKTKAEFPVGKAVPLSYTEYSKRQNEYKTKINKIISSGIIETNIKSFDEFHENLTMVYSTNSEAYHQTEVCTKFQGLEMAYHFCSLKSDDLDDLVTKWSYAAQKKGNEFGPFIKVY